MYIKNRKEIVHTKKSLPLFLCLFSLYSCNLIKASEEKYNRALILVKANHKEQLKIVHNDIFDPNECINGDPLLGFLSDKGITNALTDAIITHEKFNPNMKNSQSKRLVELLLEKNPIIAQQVMDHPQFESTRPIPVPTVKTALTILDSNNKKTMLRNICYMLKMTTVGAAFGFALCQWWYGLVPNGGMSSLD